MRTVTLPEQTLELERLLKPYGNVIYPTEDIEVVENNRKILDLGFGEQQLLHFLEDAENVVGVNLGFDTVTRYWEVEVIRNVGSHPKAMEKLLVDALVEVYKQLFK
jgi:hypothetical protein